MTNGAAWGALVLRAALGVVFIMHGYYGLMVLGRSGMAPILARMGFPPSVFTLCFGYLVAAHMLGGLMMVVGLKARWAAVANLPIMLSALILLHWPQGFFMHGVVVDVAAGKASVAGYELALLVVAATITVALTGAGRLSFDGQRTPGRRR